MMHTRGLITDAEGLTFQHLGQSEAECLKCGRPMAAAKQGKQPAEGTPLVGMKL